MDYIDSNLSSDIPFLIYISSIINLFYGVKSAFLNNCKSLSYNPFIINYSISNIISDSYSYLPR